ncbi:MAG: hypothetical protein KF889_20390 [Alphaproteobacteria bacterium]|nr:hypothetical protein [Alphaproteobacteria bacterium]MCW5744215.1 hypothetical protein [Alphaproteobacteria bacterium]
MTRAIATALLAALVLSACGPDYVRENATSEQYNRDLAACRGFTDDMMAKERGINMDREATIGTSETRYGSTRLPRQMAQRSDNLRSDKLMDMCMQQRGWTPKRNDWWPF